jgi:hypothetical protein
LAGQKVSRASPHGDSSSSLIEKRRSSAALQNVAATSTHISRLAFWSAPVLQRFPVCAYITFGFQTWAALGVIANFDCQNLFARQSRFHLIKLPETIALHAYATII